eukprot:TRINITY_DN2052_c0_g2_i1.p1 TRINITY_DN2052_c0_g2~~TRINITY_DN2052_c0_g2_i1.p1  ORF type:complete len:179 (+),score=5.20 TRINITY_DN2052_c0_g2_i1:291-827(+)
MRWVVLYAACILYIQGVDGTSAVAKWMFDGTLSDATGNGHDLTFESGAGWEVDSFTNANVMSLGPGSVGTNIACAYPTVPDTNFTLQDETVLTLWVYFNSQREKQAVVTWGSSTQPGMLGLYVENTQLALYEKGAGPYRRLGTVSVINGWWHHVVVYYHAAQVLYGCTAVGMGSRDSF